MGFDNECILNIQSLAGEYFCPVCRLLVYPNEALQSQCTHLYCKPCLTYVASTTRACPYDGYLVTTADSKPLIESNKALAETIGKIVVHCLYHRSGCTWQGPLTECINHCSGCAFGNSPVVCNRCGIQIVHRQVQEHAQNCPGVQPQVQQVGTTQDNSINATASAVDQNQPATQSAPETSQVQASQSTAILTAPGQVSNQPINSSSQGQALAQSTTVTPEQWYQQQQQQYQQYYQQYPGYDPYQQQYPGYDSYQQQYQQYYPYQQPASIQPHPSNLSSQHQTQGLMQPQPQTQGLVQPQPQTQTQPLPQVQVQPQSQLPPPPPLYVVHGQSQSTTESQTSMTTAPQTHVQFNTQQQLYPSGNAQSQIPPQIHPSSLNHSHPQPPSYPQAHPHPQQSAQTLHYQQSHPQAQNQQGQIQQQAYPQPQPQQHSVSQPQSQHHTLPQTQIAHHNQPMNINMQPQMQNPPAHAVTGHHSYPPPQPHQQLHTGVPQPTIQTPSQTGSLLQSHPTQIQDNLLQQPPMMRPMQSHVTYPNQQHPPSMLSPGQSQNTSHVPQLPTSVHAQHSGHTGNQRPTMNSVHQPTPQQQIHQKQHFVQHGQYLPQQVPIASHLGSQGPPHSLAQHNHGYLNPNTTMSNKMQQNQSQNIAGRPMGVSHGVQSLSHSQFMTVSHLRQIQTRENIPSTNQSHDYRNNNRVQLGEQLSLDSARRTTIDGHAEHKDTADKEVKPTFQKAAQTVNDSDMKPVIRGDVVELKSMKSEAEANPVDQKYSLTGNKSANVALGSELLDGGSGKPLTKETEVKTDAKESAFDHSNVDKSGDGVTKDPKEISGVDSKQMQSSDSENKDIDESLLKNPSSRDTNYSEHIGMPIMMTSAGGRESLKTTPNASVSYVDSPHKEKGKLAHHDGFHEKGQVHASGFVQPSHLVSVVDQGRHQPQPNNFGPSTPPMLPSPPSGQLYPQAPANPPIQYSLQAPGYPGHAARTSEHYLQSAIPDPGSAAPFVRRPGNYTSRQGETQFQGLDQGPPSHGASNMPLGGSSGGQGGHDLPGHVGARAPLHTSEGQLGLPHPHPIHHIGNEMVPNLRPEGGRPVSAEQGPPHLAAMHMRMNAAPGFESSLTPDEKFKLMDTERLKSFSLDMAQGEFQDDFKQLNRLSHLDTEPFQNYGAHPLRNLDRGIHGPNHDSDLQLDSLGGGGSASRFFPPHNLESGFHPSYERRDITGRTDLSHSHRDFFGSGLGYPRHHVDGLGPRSTFQDYHRINSRGFGGRPGISSFDDIDGRELRRFGDPFGNSLPESRFPFSSRSEFDGPGNFSVGEHLRSGDFIGRDRHFGHLRLGERSGFGAHPGHGLRGELDGLGSFEAFGSGNRQSHLRPGEPGFRSSFSLQGFPDDSRIYAGDKEAFGSWRKRRSLSMGWCRICKVDCETVEGLDLHSQTREHQKMAMDMVQSIKQSAKKQKLSASENPLSEDADRPTNGDLEGQGKSIK